DLLNVGKLNPRGFVLETAINKYFIDNKKRSFWTKCAAINPNKMEKEGFLKGLLHNARIGRSMVAYTGIFNQLNQIFFFCRTELSS
ncbi:MAG: hypothetical protein WD988_00785, partial [Candidatus Curtissbacteria bacterium]